MDEVVDEDEVREECEDAEEEVDEDLEEDEGLVLGKGSEEGDVVGFGEEADEEVGLGKEAEEDEEFGWVWVGWKLGIALDSSKRPFTSMPESMSSDSVDALRPTDRRTMLVYLIISFFADSFSMKIVLGRGFGGTTSGLRPLDRDLALSNCSFV